MTVKIERMLPLYEAKMIGAFDHRAADVVKSATAVKRQNQPSYIDRAAHEDPRRLPIPASWVAETDLPDDNALFSLGFVRISSPTNQRTLIAAALPESAVGDSVFLMDVRDPKRLCELLAQMNSFVLDFVVRQKVSGLNLNFFLVKQFPFLAPEVLDERCSWYSDVSLGDWISLRVLKLTYTAFDLQPLASEFGQAGSPFVWNDGSRETARAELDAAFFHLYGIERDDVGYIMETFPIVKRKDIAAHGEFRTKLMILKIYDEMQIAIDSKTPYQSAIDEELTHG